MGAETPEYDLMPDLEELYREIILDHYRSPRNRGELPSPRPTEWRVSTRSAATRWSSPWWWRTGP